MRIHQITDLHIPDEDSGPDFQHIKPNVLKQLSFVSKDNSDLLVISGDLTMRDHSREACEWLATRLPSAMNIVVIPGNHDDPAVLWDVFGEALCRNRRFFHAMPSGCGELLFLNTTTDLVPPEQLEFLASHKADGTVLFVHHPPDLVSDGFMARNQPLLNHAEVAALIGASTIEHVFCGHYHNVVDKACDGFSLHVTPSPAFQIALEPPTFTMERFEPGVRIIDLADGVVRTRMEYV